MNSQNKAFLLAGLTVLCWSTVSTAFKLALGLLTVMQLIFVSMSVAALFLGLWLGLRREFTALAGLGLRDWGKMLLLGLLLYCYYVLLFAGYERLPAQIAQPVNYTWALVLALLAALLMRQPLSWRELFFMLLAYSGGVLIAWGRGGTSTGIDPLGLACVIASTLLYAVYWILNTNSKLPAAPSLWLSFCVAALLAGLSLLILQTPWPLAEQRLHLAGTSWALPTRLTPLLPAFYVGLFELGIPFVLWGAALRLSSRVALISCFSFLTPFLAMFWIALVLGERISPATLLGLCLIVSGTLLQQRAARKIAQS